MKTLLVSKSIRNKILKQCCDGMPITFLNDNLDVIGHRVKVQGLTVNGGFFFKNEYYRDYPIPFRYSNTMSIGRTLIRLDGILICTIN
jgi:hypothetical protein